VTFGEAAKEAAKGLSASPILLLVAVINVLMLGSLLYVAGAQKEEREQLTRYLIDCHK
jgi:uncharacterized membrane protein affecting hemolysin expression